MRPIRPLLIAALAAAWLVACQPAQIDTADLVATCRGPAPRSGRAQGDIAAIPHASITSWFRWRSTVGWWGHDLSEWTDGPQDAADGSSWVTCRPSHATTAAHGARP